MQAEQYRHCQLITARQLAELLGVGQRTCWRLAARAESGEVDFPKPLRIGPRMMRWRIADVEVYVASLAAGQSRKSPELT